MRSLYADTVANFLREDSQRILGKLHDASRNLGFSQQYTTAADAWVEEIMFLKRAFESLAPQGGGTDAWRLIFEYSIPRRNKRIDVVLLTHTEIVPIEFKTGAQTPTRSALRQVEDYALDLRDFHLGSKGKKIRPLLVVPQANTHPNAFSSLFVDCVALPESLGMAGFDIRLNDLAAVDALSLEPEFDKAEWINAPYRPTPTILEAAEDLFGQHEVREISHAQTDRKNLGITTDTLLRIVHEAKANNKKVICFVTGIPGAGKTLAGLNLAHNPELRKSGINAPVFLSGNGPLVKIVRAALVKRSGKRKQDAERTVATLVQNVHSFIREGKMSHTLTAENVVIFDEAQRAWDVEQMKRKLSTRSSSPTVPEILGVRSEPATFIEIMDRHPDWAVVVALVGAGQEIHDGEAGLAEWGRTLEMDFPDWRVVASPIVLPGGKGVSETWLYKDYVPANLAVTSEPALHLDVSLRSFRAEAVTDWIDCVLEGNAEAAWHLQSKLEDFPIRLTRDLATARAWLSHRSRGLRRSGLLASSGALRLRADGLELSSGFRTGNKSMYVDWFLEDVDGIRASNQLEVVASEFECQGLELDHTGLCWGEDFVWNGVKWTCWATRGDKRQRVNKERDQRYMKNTYRVLLSRARESMVIYVSQGSDEDKTRPRSDFDATAKFLVSAGAKMIERAS